MVSWMTSSRYSEFEVMNKDFYGKVLNFREAGTQREITVLSKLLEEGWNITYSFSYRSLKLHRLLFRQREGSSRFIRKEHDSSDSTWHYYSDRI